MTDWLVRELGSEPIGPYTTEDIVRSVEDGRMGVDWEVCPAGQDNWLPIEMVPEFEDLAFVDGMTRIAQSPWFDHGDSPASVPGPPPPSNSAPKPPPPPASSAPKPPPPKSKPVPPPHPSRRRPGPPPVAPPPTAAAAGSHSYDEDDDDVMTHVVAPPSEEAEVLTAVHAPASELIAAGRRSYDDLDETMTRVAVRPSPAAPQASKPADKPFGVLPTLNMDRRELLPTGSMPMPPSRPAAGARPRFPEPTQPYTPASDGYGPAPAAQAGYGPPPQPELRTVAPGQLRSTAASRPTGRHPSPGPTDRRRCRPSRRKAMPASRC